MSYLTLPDFGLPENRHSGEPCHQSGHTQTTSSEHSLRRPRPYPAAPAPTLHPAATPPWRKPAAVPPWHRPTAVPPRRRPAAVPPWHRPTATAPWHNPAAKAPQPHPPATAPQPHPHAAAPESYPNTTAPWHNQVPPTFPPYRTEADGPRNSWVIEHDRPRDFYDRGPYGTPGWRPDTRTGRHRRGESPVPIPQSEHPELIPQSQRPDPIPAPATKEEYEARLREIAFERFMRKSADLAAAHVSHRKPSIATRIAAAFKRAIHHTTRTQRLAPSAL